MDSIDSNTKLRNFYTKNCILDIHSNIAGFLDSRTIRQILYWEIRNERVNRKDLTQENFDTYLVEKIHLIATSFVENSKQPDEPSFRTLRFVIKKIVLEHKFYENFLLLAKKAKSKWIVTERDHFLNIFSLSKKNLSWNGEDLPASLSGKYQFALDFEYIVIDSFFNHLRDVPETITDKTTYVHTRYVVPLYLQHQQNVQGKQNLENNKILKFIRHLSHPFGYASELNKKVIPPLDYLTSAIVQYPRAAFWIRPIVDSIQDVRLKKNFLCYFFLEKFAHPLALAEIFRLALHLNVLNVNEIQGFDHLISTNKLIIEIPGIYESWDHDEDVSQHLEPVLQKAYNCFCYNFIVSVFKSVFKSEIYSEEPPISDDFIKQMMTKAIEDNYLEFIDAFLQNIQKPFLIEFILFDAIRKGCVDIVKLFIKNRDVNPYIDLNRLSPDKNCTPLITALCTPKNLKEVTIPPSTLSYIRSKVLALYHEISFEIARELISAGADVNKTNDNGQTPLMFACSSKYLNDLRIVEYLLQMGADSTVKDINGCTALDYANEADFPNPNKDKIVALFKKANADSIKLIPYSF